MIDKNTIASRSKHTPLGMNVESWLITRGVYSARHIDIRSKDIYQQLGNLHAVERAV